MSIQTIRDGSKGTMAKIIVGFIIFTFAIFGVDAIIGFSGGDNEAATVNGNAISSVQLARSTELLRRQANDPNISEDILAQQALNNLIGRQLLVEDAESLKLYISSGRVDQEILQSPTFQSNGAFDRTLFEIALRNIGLTPLDYRNQLATDMLFEQNRLGISGSAFLTKPELDKLISIGEQTRDVSYLTVVADSLGKDLEFSAEEMRSYYDANLDRFTTRESVSIEYLELKVSDFYAQVEVDDLEIQQRYQQEVIAASDAEERQASHILVTVDDDKSRADALAKAEDIQKQLLAGADFAELARQHSEDPGSAQAGGDLGFTPRGSFVSEFEETLYNLAESEISDIVETGFGFHLIKLTGIQTPEPPSLEERKGELEQEIRHGKAEQLFVTASEDLQNDAYSAGDLAEPASNAGLEVQRSEYFTREGGDAGITANPQVVKTAFSDEVLNGGNNSDMIEITRDHIVVLRVKEHRLAEPMAYETVATDITAALLADATRSKAQENGEQIISELRGGATLETIASSSGSQWLSAEKVSRGQSDLNPQLVQALFKMPKPAAEERTYTGLTLANGDFVVIALTGVSSDADIVLEQSQLRAARAALAGQFGAMDFTEYQRALREKAEIVTY